MTLSQWRARARSAGVVGSRILAPLVLLAGCGAERITSGTMAAADSLPAPVTMAGPSPSLVTTGTHEPTGFKPLLVLPLTSVSGNGSGPVGIKSWAGHYALVNDVQRGSVMQCDFGASMKGGSPACTIWANETAIRAQNVSRIYLRTWVMPSTSFKGHTSGVNKVGYVGFGAKGNQFFFSLSGVGSSPLRLRMNVQNVAPPLPVGAGAGWNGPSCSSSLGCSWSPPASGPVIQRGKWALVELLLTSGAAGSRSSSMTAWVDGQPAGTVTGFDFLFPLVQGTNKRAEKFTISTYWGGTGGTVGNPAFNVRLSDYYVSGAP